MKLTKLTLIMLISQGIALTANPESNIVLVAPGSWGNIYSNDPLAKSDYNCWHALRAALEAKGYLLQQIRGRSTKDYKVILSNAVDAVSLPGPKEKLILLLWEPPVIEPFAYDKSFHKPFSKIFTGNDDLVDNVRYFKLYYPEYRNMIEDVVNFDEKKLCCLMARDRNSSHPNELYSERRKVIDFFEKKMNGTFDLYGTGWNRYKNYKGSVPDKIACIKHYRFCYCYENVKNINGWITEKIFNCFQAGCVPIYWGAKNIEMYIPKSCFVAREDFANDEDLYTFISTMQREQYEEYLYNIKNYLDNDPRAQLFSLDNFVKIMMNAIL
jgi:hypothetical protein